MLVSLLLFYLLFIPLPLLHSHFFIHLASMVETYDLFIFITFLALYTTHKVVFYHLSFLVALMIVIEI